MVAKLPGKPDVHLHRARAAQTDRLGHAVAEWPMLTIHGGFQSASGTMAEWPFHYTMAP
jgi:hypothetical protein